MKKLLLATILCCFNAITAQEQSLTGTIKLKKDSDLANISVMLFQSEKDILQKTSLTNKEGIYSFSNIPDGNYYLQINAIGYEEYKSERILKNSASVTIPVIILKEKTNELSEVVVKTKKPIVQVLADKTVFNVQNTLNATGITGFELLRKAPGIIIDNNDLDVWVSLTQGAINSMPQKAPVIEIVDDDTDKRLSAFGYVVTDYCLVDLSHDPWFPLCMCNSQKTSA